MLLDKSAILSLIQSRTKKSTDQTQGFSSDDISQATGLSRTTANTLIRSLVQEGKAELAGTVERYRTDGKAYHKPLYRLVENKPSKTSKTKKSAKPRKCSNSSGPSSKLPFRTCTR